MKSVNHVFEVAVSEEVRKKSVHAVCKKKRKSKIFRSYAKDEEKAVRDAEKWLLNYTQIDHHYIYIYEGTSRKPRKIVVPTFRELTVQHCIVEALKAMFKRGMYKHTYAAIPKWKVRSGNIIDSKDQLIWDLRGAHAGKNVIEKWLKDKKNTKYVLKMDIHHFFDSIPHDILKEKFRKYVHDDRMLALIYETIDIKVDGAVTDIGLPLGFDTSHWYANWYLQDLDHYIKEDLKATYYIRYMDDMVIFGSNKRKLHRIKEAIEKYLAEKLRLELKGDWQVFRFVYKEITYTDETGRTKKRKYGRDLDFMGFRFYRNRTVMRKSIMLKCARKAKKISKKDKLTIYDARQMVSYNSYLKATDTYNVYLKHIKPYISMKDMRQKISRYEKNRRKQDEICLH